jgi:hypothetical protein
MKKPKDKIIIPVSTGELIDKITILEIKRKKIKDKKKKGIILNELELLNKEFEKLSKSETENFIQIKGLMGKLSVINKELWKIEDRIREYEMKKDFSDEFINLARQVYLNNDKRFAIKNKIDKLSNSEIQEVKEYKGLPAQ